MRVVSFLQNLLLLFSLLIFFDFSVFFFLNYNCRYFFGIGDMESLEHAWRSPTWMMLLRFPIFYFICLFGIPLTYLVHMNNMLVISEKNYQ